MQTTISVVFFQALYGLSRLLPLITESSMHCIIVMFVLYPNVKPQLYILDSSVEVCDQRVYTHW